VKLITEEIEREEEAWREDLYSSNRKFAEYYNVRTLFCISFVYLILLFGLFILRYFHRFG